MLSPLNKSLLSLLLIAACWLPVQGRRIRVSHNAAAAEALRIEDNGALSVTDSLTLAADIRLSGYDKTRESSTESIFVTNQGTSTLLSLKLRVEYKDMDSRQLHQRTVSINCRIPSGETRMLSFRTWDTQHSFFFHRSRRPARTQATPYDVVVTVLEATFEK